MSSVDESSELFFTKWQLTVEPFGNSSRGYRAVLPSALSMGSGDLCQYEDDLTGIRSVCNLPDLILSTLDA